MQMVMKTDNAIIKVK